MQPCASAISECVQAKHVYSYPRFGNVIFLPENITTLGARNSEQKFLCAITIALLEHCMEKFEC